MYNRELENLIRQYKNPVSEDDVLIQMELENIRLLCDRCEAAEWKFANAITQKFCQVIRILKDQQQNLQDEIEGIYTIPQKDLHYYISYRQENVPFRRGEELIEAFGEYLATRAKNGKTPTAATIFDYQARVKTFAKKYLHQVYPPEQWQQAPDKILFVYQNIDDILRKFSIEDETGQPNKQKRNIRSVLGNLSDFKRENELNR